MVHDDIFAALAAGGGGERAVRFLVQAERSKHQLLLRLVVATAARVGHPRAAELFSAYQLLADLQADQPSDVEPLLRNPPLGAWAIQAVHDLHNGENLDYGYLVALAASAAFRARADSAIDVPLDSGHLFLPGLGSAYFTAPEPPETARVYSSAEGGEIFAGRFRIPIPANPRLDGDGWRGIRQLAVDAAGVAMSFLFDDLDPYRLPCANTTGRLDAVAFGQWQRALDDAWDLLAAHHPETAEEIAAGLTVLVPLQASQEHLVSATSRHSFGAVALSRPSEGCALAAAFAHERQHAKLSALLDLVALMCGLSSPRLARNRRKVSSPSSRACSVSSRSARTLARLVAALNA